MFAHRDDGVVDLREFVGVQREAELLGALADGVAARVTAEDELVGLLPDVDRPHDLVGARILQHAVLVNAGFVREGVAPDDRLVRLDRFGGELREQLARLEQQRRVDRGVVRQTILANAQRHHQFLERRVAGALADAVDGALDLPDTALHGRQAVGDGETEVVVAVGAEDRLVRVRHAADDLLEELARFLWHAVADGVGEVDGRRTGVDGGLNNPAEEVAIAARRILCRKLHIVHQVAGAADVLHDRLEALLARHAELGREVQVGGCQKGVNALALGRFERLGSLVDVFGAAAGERRNNRPANLERHLAGGFSISRRGDRETCLDDVHPECVEGTRHAQLGRHVHRETGCLFTVAQRRVKDDNSRGIVAHGVQL